MKYLRSKLFLLFFAGFFILFLTSDFSLIDIEKTAIIIALGVDKTDDEFEITAQIAVPQATDKNKTNTESVISGKGKTVYEAVDEIGTQTGWYPKLSFCNMIIIGENLLSENVMDTLDYFIRSYRIEDTALLCIAEGTAKDLLLQSSPLDQISSFALIKIFVKEYDRANFVLASTVKEFSIGYYSRSHFGYIPYVKTVKTEDKSKSQQADSGLSGSSGNQGSGKSSSDSSSGGEESPVVFDATTTYLFNKGYKTGELNNEETLFFSLLTKQVNNAYFSVDAVDNEGNDGTFLFNISNTSKKVKLDYKKEPILKLNLSMGLKVEDANKNQSIYELSKGNVLSGHMLYKAEEKAKTVIEGIVKETLQSQCDMFEIVNKCYRFYNKKYKENGENIMSDLKYEITVSAVNSN